MMKKKLFWLLIPAALVGLWSFSLFQGPFDQSNKERILKDLIFQGLINQAHYNNLPIDDDLSAKAFKQYLSRIDGGKHFLLKSDVEKLSVHKLYIDDEIKGSESKLLPLAIEILNQRTKEVKVITDELLAQPFNFQSNDAYETDADKRDYLANQAELKEEWRRYLTYQAMLRYYTRQETEQKKAEDAKKKGKPIKNKVMPISKRQSAKS